MESKLYVHVLIFILLDCYIHYLIFRKALKVPDLKAILQKANVPIGSKSNKQDLIAKIIASSAAVDAYNSLHPSEDAPPSLSSVELPSPPLSAPSFSATSDAPHVTHVKQSQISKQTIVPQKYVTFVLFTYL